MRKRSRGTWTGSIPTKNDRAGFLVLFNKIVYGYETRRKAFLFIFVQFFLQGKDSFSTQQ